MLLQNIALLHSATIRRLRLFTSLSHLPRAVLSGGSKQATMVSVDESKALFSLLNADERSFDEVMSDFDSKFPSSLHFRLCTALATLLQVLKQSAADYIKGFESSSHVFPPCEQLHEKFCSKARPEPYSCLFKNSVKNVIPDPDVPQCDANSVEFDLQPGDKLELGIKMKQ